MRKKENGLQITQQSDGQPFHPKQAVASGTLTVSGHTCPPSSWSNKSASTEAGNRHWRGKNEQNSFEPGGVCYGTAGGMERASWRRAVGSDETTMKESAAGPWGYSAFSAVAW